MGKRLQKCDKLNCCDSVTAIASAPMSSVSSAGSLGSQERYCRRTVASWALPVVRFQSTGESQGNASGRTGGSPRRSASEPSGMCCSRRCRSSTACWRNIWRRSTGSAPRGEAGQWTSGRFGRSSLTTTGWIASLAVLWPLQYRGVLLGTEAPAARRKKISLSRIQKSLRQKCQMN